MSCIRSCPFFSFFFLLHTYNIYIILVVGTKIDITARQWGVASSTESGIKCFVFIELHDVMEMV